MLSSKEKKLLSQIIEKIKNDNFTKNDILHNLYRILNGDLDESISNVNLMSFETFDKTNVENFILNENVLSSDDDFLRGMTNKSYGVYDKGDIGRLAEIVKELKREIDELKNK